SAHSRLKVVAKKLRRPIYTGKNSLSAYYNSCTSYGSKEKKSRLSKKAIGYTEQQGCNIVFLCVSTPATPFGDACIQQTIKEAYLHKFKFETQHFLK
ncbi:hypothetical protein M5D96_010778, partial [Drosophila gunungcola]